MFFQKFSLAGKAVRASLTLLIFSAVFHATPIKENRFRRLGLETRKPGVALTGADGALELTDAFVASNPKSKVSSNPGTAACLLASNCSNPVGVSEPQLLLLFGTGLLSVATMIRRRLLS
jgi:hypothetical protein